MPSDELGLVDVEALGGLLDGEVAGIMLTNPNTLGLFEERIKQITGMVHDVGGLVYYDGANLNSILGSSAPATWASTSCTSTPTRRSRPLTAGEAGRGPVGVTERLARYIPKTILAWETTGARRDRDRPI